MTRADVSVAIFSAILFGMLVVLSYVSYFRQFWLSPFILCLGICLPIRLRSCRQAVTRKRDRRMLLPLSMFEVEEQEQEQPDSRIRYNDPEIVLINVDRVRI
ncbi:hypothetical protein EZV62_014196 [Acer yangbiense]|uniref:Uncharacterized protein n=1 Tax=Acer yangbiense TaxID=1000413 RepID=A0A5C7HRD7_9ROSI|nr:hypothetical protein EZV62_014196 [Acer yangbiense]